jgi:hypothetical protein
MKTYTATFRTDAEFATRDFESDIPNRALAFARQLRRRSTYCSWRSLAMVNFMLDQQPPRLRLGLRAKPRRLSG